MTAEAGRRVLFVAEKPSQYKWVAEGWAAVFPADELRPHYALTVGTTVMDIPLPGTPPVAPVLSRRDLREQPSDFRKSDFRDDVAWADLLVCATDPDPTGARNFFALCEYHGVDPMAGPSCWIVINSLALEDVVQAVKAPRALDDPLLLKMRDCGEANWHWSWLHGLNVWPILTEAFRREGADPALALLSKYQLQLLFYLVDEDMPPMIEGELSKMMQAHFSRRSEGCRGMGSPASRHLIVSGLAKAGLLDVIPKRGRRPESFVPSAFAERLTARLHADMRVVDLPRRIAAWGACWQTGRVQMEEAFCRSVEAQLTQMRA